MPDRGSVGKTANLATGRATDPAHYTVTHIYYGQVAQSVASQSGATQPSPSAQPRIPLPLGDPLFTSE